MEDPWVSVTTIFPPTTTATVNTAGIPEMKLNRKIFLALVSMTTSTPLIGREILPETE